MPFVVFVTPFFNEAATRFITALTELPGVRCGAISQEPLDRLAPHLRAKLALHWRIDDIVDTDQLAGAARELAARGGVIDRLLGVQEQLQVQIAEVREALGIAGMRADVARNFRDKARMKEILRAAGLPCARHRLITDHAAAHRFVGEVGFPIVVKPPAGAATQDTFRVDSPAALDAALAAAVPGPGRATLLEEFVTGDEYSFETVSLGGRALWHSLTRYLPTPLEAMREAWIQWRVVLPREIDGPEFDDIRAAATRALDVLGMETGLSHLEWFRRRDGLLAISEVAARPPGAQITTLMSRAHDFDTIGAYTRLMVFDQFNPPARRYAAGAAFLRGQGQGRVRAIHGLAQAQREVSSLITDVKLPEIGQTPSPSYEGEGYVVVRHPETAVVTQALLRIVTLVRVELG